jgi:hypothetical protein
MAVSPTPFNISGPAAIAGQQHVYNAIIPDEGPRAVGFELDFVNYNENDIDFTYAYEQKQMTVVQAVWVDNTANAEELVITATNAPRQVIKVGPGIQGAFPVISAIRPKFALTTNGSCIVNVIFVNVPLMSFSDQPAPVLNAGKAASGATVIANGTTAVAVFDPSVSPNPSDGAVIVNPRNATESLWVDMIARPGVIAPGTNGTTVELIPGGSFIVPPDYAGTVWANAVTNGHTFTAYGAGS